MKYIVLLGDGMADYPLPELGEKTPLMVAKTPFMDFLAQKGVLGRVQTVPKGLTPGSDVANLSVMGYDPAVFYPGRAPLEAASMKIPLGANDVAFRCNLVTLTDKNGQLFMEDYSAGHIANKDAHAIIKILNDALSDEQFSFYPGVSYRHLMIWKSGNSGLKTTPPHDITGKEIGPYLPQGNGSEILKDLMAKSKKILLNASVNERRKQKGDKEVSSIWLWGQGKSITIPSFKKKYDCSGAVISAVDLIKGIGLSAGLEPIDVPGATGFLDTNYYGKAEYAINALHEKDFVFVHVEAPDEAAHNGNIRDKIKAIEDFDEKVVGTVLTKIKQFSSYRVLVLPDHATPIQLKTHASDPVPFVIYPSPEDVVQQKLSPSFDEESAANTGLFFPQGHKLMDYFILGMRE
ncbi:MAG: cofactor-independent phosphoglycerate mutase [Thermodesulfobacteriota bacterium]|jgi:2,3-bisphosphoglycerate-independent phosphoglycerate mutase|nr:MAG: cofactor-independent phosphoglycerate mutase [Thermodesulfobacteriota bacterium]